MLFWTGGYLSDFLLHQFYFLPMSNILIGWCLKQEAVSLRHPALSNVVVKGRPRQFLSSRCLLTLHVKASLASPHQPQGGSAILEDRCCIRKSGMSSVRKETIKRRGSFHSGHSCPVSPAACSAEWHPGIPSLGANPSCPGAILWNGLASHCVHIWDVQLDSELSSGLWHLAAC